MRTRFDEEELNVDMSPLIDCVFLLLIFFLVATTLKKIDKELPLDLPDAKATLDIQQPNEYGVIGVDREGIFYLDGLPCTIEQMRTDLRAASQKDPEKKFRLDVDKNVAFHKVMEILDMLRFEKLTNVGINTRNDKG
ncbi:MAG: biopolymer transporter ExbD [Planctomycetes bacterium]|nr:biopolymer transporter ExbD [Planctomycetota bacterium]